MAQQRKRVLTVFGTSVPFSPPPGTEVNLSANMFDDNPSATEAYFYAEGMHDLSMEAAEAIELLLCSGWTTAEVEELTVSECIELAGSLAQGVH